MRSVETICAFISVLCTSLADGLCLFLCFEPVNAIKEQDDKEINWNKFICILEKKGRKRRPLETISE